MSRTLFNRVVWLQALTTLLLLAPWVGASTYVWTQHQLIQTLLTDLSPRYARLSGLLARQTDLQKLGDQTRAQLSGLAFAPAQDLAQVGNDAQQRIRTVFADNALEIISIQVLPPLKDEGKFDRIQINLRVEGNLTGVQNALAALALQSPKIVLDNLALQTIGAVRPASIQRLGGQFNFTVLRLRA